MTQADGDNVEAHEGNLLLHAPQTHSYLDDHGDGPERVVHGFHFDHIYNSVDPEGEVFHSSADVFRDLGTPMLEAAWAGFNCTFFAYGQTGSGKTHSVMGTPDDQGLVPRFCRTLFEQIEEKEGELGASPAAASRGGRRRGAALPPELRACRVTASYLEIYNERVYDLLAGALLGHGREDLERPALKVREHPKLGPYVDGLQKAGVEDYEQVAALLEAGSGGRHTAATQMNAQSSRSHALFVLELEQTGERSVTRSIVNLVDLAGSERSKEAGTRKTRLKEGIQINKSLATLGRCINALSVRDCIKRGGAAPKREVVPFRESVLTWLLREALGGNSQTVMLSCISPADVNFEESLNTLRFVQRESNSQSPDPARPAC
jgi:hypothetical protein